MFSDLYEACRKGDVDLAQAIIATSPSKASINRVESNGDTALHAAVNNSDVEMVRLLLHKFNVPRHECNRKGLTAYEEALTDDIRQLFHRPKNDLSRFCNNENVLTPVSAFNNGGRPQISWVRHYDNESEANGRIITNMQNEYGPNIFSLIDAMKFFVGIDPVRKKIEKWSRDLKCVLDESLTPTHSLYLHACELLQNYVETRRIEPLLRLYTLDITFCRSLARGKVDYLFAPISFNLWSVKTRAYKGRCYRGLIMTNDDFQVYRRALNDKESYLGTNTFCSTSTDRNVAECFTYASKDELGILMIFDFAQTCSTALVLYQLSSELPCISYFVDENEVLILPGTIFRATKIEENASGQQQIIYLENYNTDYLHSTISQNTHLFYQGWP